jgi:hypothetical protein
MRFSLDIVALGENLGRLGLPPTGFASSRPSHIPRCLGAGLALSPQDGMTSRSSVRNVANGSGLAST